MGLQWAYQVEPFTKARPGAHRYGIPGVFRDLWTIPARYKGAYGGRGSGKSHNFAAMAVTRASEIDGLRIACIREIQNTLDQSVKTLVEDKISSLGFRGFEPLERITRTPGGGLIIYRGMQSFNADNVKSLEGFDVVWVEEAHSLSQYSLDILRPTLRKPGSEYWFSWNPSSPDDPVDRFLRAERPPDSIVVEANWCDNPYFPEVLRQDKEYDLRRSPERYAHIWMGAYRIRSEAQVFRNWRVEEFESPSEAMFRLGADWGYSIDPSVLIRCWVDRANRKLYIDYEAWQIGCEIENLPALFETVPGARKHQIVADSSRPDTISYLRGNGFNIVAAAKGKGSVEEGIEWLQNYDMIVHPRCQRTISELTNYSWKIDKRTDIITNHLEERDNHLIDSLRYALESERRGISMVDYL